MHKTCVLLPPCTAFLRHPPCPQMIASKALQRPEFTPPCADVLLAVVGQGQQHLASFLSSASLTQLAAAAGDVTRPEGCRLRLLELLAAAVAVLPAGQAGAGGGQGVLACALRAWKGWGIDGCWHDARLPQACCAEGGALWSCAWVHCGVAGAYLRD